MFDKLKQAVQEAKGKVTTYVGILIASSGEIRDNWSQVNDFTKGHPYLDWAAKHVYVVLGVLVIYTRIRRALNARP